MSTFESLGLTKPVLDALETEGYTTPTPIQEKAVPHVLAGRDLFGIAQTGTGKTAAFALPLIERMLANPCQVQPRRCRTLVLAPTRKLAGQIYESFRAYGRNARIRSTVIYGGVNQRPQATAMMRGVDVLVATPGRLLDLVNQRLVDIRSLEYLVLDEADRMLDMGFIHDIRRIIAMLPKERQTLFFSATLPPEVKELAAAMLRNPLEVKTAPQAAPADTVDQAVFHIPQKQKRHLLVHLLKTEGMSRTIVFTRTKHGADRLARDLEKSGINAAAIHGNKSQNQRERALAAFKSQRPPVLIATDIAARGIDVDNVSHVVNFELSHEPETYVHRIGRTGRAGQTGKAFAFCDHEERSQLKAIERLIRRTIPVRQDLPELPKIETGGEEGLSQDRGLREGGRQGNRSRGDRPHGSQRGAVIGGDSANSGNGPRRRKKRRFGDRSQSGGSHEGASSPGAGGEGRSTIRHKHTRGGHTGGPQPGGAATAKPAKKKHRRAL
ncbi:MAG: DEAD/DEAH box helicase [Pirellulales bacterium]